MTEAQKQFQEAFDKLSTFTIPGKIQFLENLLFNLTIGGRGIWSDDNASDTEKVEALKWLNELSHRYWNVLFELKRGEDNDSITRMYENMKFYGEQSTLLRSHLWPTFFGAFDKTINTLPDNGS